MDESWFDDAVVITGGVTFVARRGVHPVCLMLELGDWPDCPQKCLSLPAGKAFWQICISRSS